jgi:8-oxo-dGTP pyrophosphatase MutT (NUDIX family)
VSPPDAPFDALRSALPLERSPWVGAGRQAAVLVALTDESPTQVILGRRGRHLPLHPGEVAFPGGKRESGDRGPWDTALREAREEMTLAPDTVEPLAELAPLHTRTRYAVFPCIGRVPASPRLIVDPREFDSAFLLPLPLFAERERFRLEPVPVGRQMRLAPHYDVGGDTIWGVTAAVLALLANVAYDAGLELQRNWNLPP